MGLGISRSTDGGRHWRAPSVIPARPGEDFDKNWIVCDNNETSRFFGHCYSTWDDSGHINLLLSATSTDGGLTVVCACAHRPTTRLASAASPWCNATAPSSFPPQTWSDPGARVLGRPTEGRPGLDRHGFGHPRASVSGGLRTSALPSAEMDRSGTVYVAWQDCRFRTGCCRQRHRPQPLHRRVAWTTPSRIPIDPVSSTPTTSSPASASTRIGRPEGSPRTHLLLLSTSLLHPRTCRLEVGFISSGDTGATWTTPRP